MSYQVLARKWRPKTFRDVIGQAPIVHSLINAILKKKVGHAYVFVGTRGVGKTTLARLFAKAVRCDTPDQFGEACEQCPACLDFDTETSMNVIEIDGASNNSVDNIRELISNVNYLPTTGKFKVYIVDEVHMLSTSAFNALLKTLEEPPAHVLFLFATTEPQKLLGTVLSRCQRFDLRHIQTDELKKYLELISEKENIKYETEALLWQLAELGNGSVRDALSLLDQVLTFSEENIIYEKVFTSSLGVVGPTAAKKFVQAILEGNVLELRTTFSQMLQQNIPLKNILSSTLKHLFIEIDTNTNYRKAELIWCYENIAKETTWVLNSLLPEKTIELLLVKVTIRRTFFGQLKAVPETNHEVKEEKKEEVKAENKMEIDRDWSGFLTYLNGKSMAFASNLEQGNILRPLKLTADSLSVDIGFTFSAQVFLEYLKENEVYEKLLSYLADYFQKEKSAIHLNLVEVKEREEFVSMADLKHQVKIESEVDRVNQFKSNPLLKEAEKIFNSKIDKVILESKNKE